MKLPGQPPAYPKRITLVLERYDLHDGMLRMQKRYVRDGNWGLPKLQKIGIDGAAFWYLNYGKEINRLFDGAILDIQDDIVL